VAVGWFGCDFLVQAMVLEEIFDSQFPLSALLLDKMD
jgi:hypothetical protein